MRRAQRAYVGLDYDCKVRKKLPRKVACRPRRPSGLPSLYVSKKEFKGERFRLKEQIFLRADESNLDPILHYYN